MGDMPRLNLIRLLKDDGYVYDSSTGGHDFYIKGSRKVGVPRHKKDIKDPVLGRILREAGLKHRRR